MKIDKSHTKIQIYEFLVPQLVVLRDSEKIWKHLISCQKLHFSEFLGYLRKNPEIFLKKCDFPKTNVKLVKIHKKNTNLRTSNTPATSFERFRENLEKLNF